MARVIMAGGPGGAVEYYVGQITGDREAMWRAELDAEYLDRVKARAAQKAKEILVQAEAEAKEIRRRAMEEGFAQGLEQADQQVEQARKDMAAKLGQALKAVDQGRKAVWSEYRKDLAALASAAVDKILAVELSANRREVIAAYLDQAVEILDTERRLTLRVHPSDKALMAEILQLAAKELPEAAQWKVASDPDLEPGSLIVDSGDGLVDNSQSSRRAAVMALLDQLRLPGHGGHDPGAESA